MAFHVPARASVHNGRVPRLRMTSAQLLSILAVRLARAGRVEDSLTASERSVDAYERLAAAHPAVYEPVLAQRLNNLAVRLAKTGLPRRRTGRKRARRRHPPTPCSMQRDRRASRRVGRWSSRFAATVGRQIAGANTLHSPSRKR